MRADVPGRAAGDTGRNKFRCTAPARNSRELLVDVPCTTLPVGGAQILLQDAEIPHLTRGFEAAAVSMALQWHSTSVLRFRFR